MVESLKETDKMSTGGSQILISVCLQLHLGFIPPPPNIKVLQKKESMQKPKQLRTLFLQNLL